MQDDSMSAYAPIRQRNQLWWKYGSMAGKEGRVSADGRIASNLNRMIDDYLIRLYAEGFVANSRNHPDFPEMFGYYAAKIEGLQHWVPLVAQYELNGRQIFDLSDRLVEMFSETDLGECSLEGLHLPYDAFFIRFGKQDRIKLPYEDDFEYLEGAYVARTPFDETGFRYKFGFTTVSAQGKGYEMPGYFLDIRPDEQNLPVLQAVEKALARKMALFADKPGDTANDLALNAHRRDFAQESHSLMRDGAALLVNALFYLESFDKSSIDPEPGRDSSSEVVARWHQEPLVKRRKQVSQLTASGYALVRMMGREVEMGDQYAAEGGGVRTHWRRGHWRQQPYGEGSKLRRRTWIRPMMIAAAHGGNVEVPGHIYVAGSESRH